MSHFKALEMQPDDPIFGIVPLFLADKREEKINLSIGAYQDDSGITTLLKSVAKAERIILEERSPKNYLPIAGDPGFCRAIEELIYGKERGYLGEKGVSSAQTIGASGALRLGAEILKKAGVESIALSEPSWANHEALMKSGGLEVARYRYYDAEMKSIDFTGMIRSIEGMPKNSALLLHACCHNPTGCDLNEEQWKALSHIARERGLIPFFDCAYHGFSRGLDEDIAPVRLFARDGHELLVAYSFSKNMGLYGERAGALSCVIDRIGGWELLQSNFKKLIRATYSSSPIHAAKIPYTILSDEALKGEWFSEVDEMRSRILSVRELLLRKLSLRGEESRYSFLKRQSGMFSFTGLTKEQVKRIKEEFAVYMPASGRINVAGLNGENIDHFVHALLAVGSS